MRTLPDTLPQWSHRKLINQPLHKYPLHASLLWQVFFIILLSPITPLFLPTPLNTITRSPYNHPPLLIRHFPPMTRRLVVSPLPRKVIFPVLLGGFGSGEWREAVLEEWVVGGLVCGVQEGDYGVEVGDRSDVCNS